MNRVGIFLLLCSLAASARAAAERYIVELEGEPAATYAASRGHRAHGEDPEFRARTAAIHAQHQLVRTAVEAEGAEVVDHTSAVTNTLVVRISPEQAERLRRVPGVKQVHPDRIYQRSLDHALPLLHVPDAWNLVGGMGQAGAGIKIAILDTGIDTSHAAFQDGGLTAPAGFPKVNNDSDLTYTNQKVIVARAYQTRGNTAPPATDTEGHGTGVAMAAAGESVTGPYGQISGVAPQAFLGNYKVFPSANDGAPTSLIIKAIDDAVNDGMDVLNLSLGALGAQRPADDILVTAVERAAAAGKIVTVAVGNDGSDPNTIGSPASAPSAIAVGNMWNDRVFGSSAQVGSLPVTLAIPGDGPNPRGSVSGPLKDVADLDPTALACNSFDTGSLNGTVALILRGTCTFETKINNAAAAGALAAIIYTDAARPDAEGMAVGSAVLPAVMVSNAAGLQFKTALAGGSTQASVNFTKGPVSVNPYKLSFSSSRGPNSDNGIKPDLVAVGTQIYTARPNGFIVESGTSFSSPIVAGAAAVLEGARPGLSMQQYRSLLINSASALVPDSPVPTPVQQTGSGMLNLASALQSTVTTVPASLSFGVTSGSVDQTKTLTITNVGTAADTYSVTVLPLNAGAAPVVAVNTVQLAPGQSQDVQVQFTQSGLSGGAYQGFIQVQGTRNAVLARVPYWFAVPSQKARYLTIIDAPTQAKASSKQYIDFRITDSEGVPVDATPDVTAVEGAGKVLSVDSIDSDVPGAWEATIRMSVSGTAKFHIELNGVGKDVSISVASPSSDTP